MNPSVLEALEKQVVLGFTGKVNFMHNENSQLLGHALVLEGELINVIYKGCEGEKAFYNVCIESQETELNTVVEPEIIDQGKRKINHPFSVLKRRLIEISDLYARTRENKPPEDVLLEINPSFLSGNIEVSSNEFNILCTLVDHKLVGDIYKKNSLLDFQITNALIELRQKKAIKVIAQKGSSI